MKVSLTSQIAEVDRELAQRKLVYPRLVANRGMRQSIADLQVAHLQAVRDTLVWLKEHELLIKQRTGADGVKEALSTAVRHIEHMSAWIGNHNAGYSFEGLGEDMPGIRAALVSIGGDKSK